MGNEKETKRKYPPQIRTPAMPFEEVVFGGFDQKAPFVQSERILLDRRERTERINPPSSQPEIS